MRDWNPKTLLGKKVKRGEITTMKDALKARLPIREPEIIDALLPDLYDEVLDVNMVQRMTDSGRRVKFTVTTVVGNKDGYIGIGICKGKEVGPTIRKAIDNAKLNMIQIRRGCGSWECGCGDPHTVPFEVTGKAGSVSITLKPAPSGIGLATGETAKSILERAGIQDVWAFSKGHTRTTINYAKAVFDALKETSKMRVGEEQGKKVGVIEGEIVSKKPENKVEEDSE